MTNIQDIINQVASSSVAEQIFVTFIFISVIVTLIVSVMFMGSFLLKVGQYMIKLAFLVSGLGRDYKRLMKQRKEKEGSYFKF